MDCGWDLWVLHHPLAGLRAALQVSLADRLVHQRSFFLHLLQSHLLHHFELLRLVQDRRYFLGNKGSKQSELQAI